MSYIITHYYRFNIQNTVPSCVCPHYSPNDSSTLPLLERVSSLSLYSKMAPSTGRNVLCQIVSQTLLARNPRNLSFQKLFVVFFQSFWSTQSRSTNVFFSDFWKTSFLFGTATVSYQIPVCFFFCWDLEQTSPILFIGKQRERNNSVSIHA